MTDTSAAVSRSSDAHHSAEIDLEYRINLAALRMATSPLAEERAKAWRELQQLHQQRSAARIVAMELEQGLTRCNG